MTVSTRFRYSQVERRIELVWFKISRIRDDELKLGFILLTYSKDAPKAVYQSYRKIFKRLSMQIVVPDIPVGLVTATQEHACNAALGSPIMYSSIARAFKTDLISDRCPWPHFIRRTALDWGSRSQMLHSKCMLACPVSYNLGWSLALSLSHSGFLSDQVQRNYFVLISFAR